MFSTKSVIESKGLLGPRKEEAKYPRTPRRTTQKETDRIAQHLVDKFNSPSYRPIFLKAAWRLDRGTIDRYVASAFELAHEPRAYFISLVKKDKRYNAKSNNSTRS